MTSPAPRERRHVTDHTPYKLVEKMLFDSRYMLVLAYAGATLALVAYIAYSAWECFLFTLEIWGGDEASATIGMLSALDSIMIANVVYFIIAGSYTVYVRDRIDDLTFVTQAERPQALRHLSPGTLKEKMAASLIGVSSVNLLQILINVGNSEVRHQDLDWFSFTVKVVIHVVLLAGLMIFAWANAKEESGGGHHDTAAPAAATDGHHDTAAPTAPAPEHNGHPIHAVTATHQEATHA